MGYEIRIVSNEEFDSLPYKKAKTSLGLADAKTGVAYIRETGVRELDQATIDHEFDELVSKISPHEEDGIRYKSGGGLGGILAPILGAAITVLSGGTLAPLGVAVGSAGSIGTSQYSKVQKPEKYGKPGQFGDIAKSGIVGGLGAYSGGQMGLGAVSGFKSAAPGFLSKAGGALKGAVGMGSGAASSNAANAANTPAMSLSGGGVGNAAGQALSTTGAPAMSMVGGGVGNAAGQLLSNSAPAGASLLSKFGSFTGNAAKKIGSSMATNTMMGALSPQPPTAQAAQTLFPTSRTPASNVGAIDLYGSEGALSRFNPTLSGALDAFNPISQEEYDLGIQNLTKAKQNRMADIFRTPAFRGQTVDENSQLARQIANLNTGFGKELNQYNLDIDAANLSREYNAVKKQNKLSDEQMSKFIDIAQLDDAGIKQQISNNTPDEIRAIFKHLKKLA